MGNPVLMVLNAGHGVTPPVPHARFARGDVVHWGRIEAVVLVAIPPGFSPDYALADLVGEPRPLMIRKGSRAVTYILAREDDRTPYLARERDLRTSGKPPVEIGTVTREAAHG